MEVLTPTWPGLRDPERTAVKKHEGVTVTKITSIVTEEFLQKAKSLAEFNENTTVYIRPWKIHWQIFGSLHGQNKGTPV